jgi:hypothetical protein
VDVSRSGPYLTVHLFSELEVHRTGCDRHVTRADRHVSGPQGPNFRDKPLVLSNRTWHRTPFPSSAVPLQTARPQLVTTTFQSAPTNLHGSVLIKSTAIHFVSFSSIRTINCFGIPRRHFINYDYSLEDIAVMIHISIFCSTNIWRANYGIIAGLNWGQLHRKLLYEEFFQN